MILASSPGFLFFKKKNHILRFLRPKEYFCPFSYQFMSWFILSILNRYSIYPYAADDRRNWLGKGSTRTIPRYFKNWQNRYIYDRIPSFISKLTPKEPYVCNNLKTLFHLSFMNKLNVRSFSPSFFSLDSTANSKEFCIKLILLLLEGLLK